MSLLIAVIAFAVSVVFFFFEQRKDAEISEEGFKLGYTEANSLIRWLTHSSHPDYGQLVMANYIIAIIAWWPVLFGSTAGFGIAAFFTLLLCLKHYLSVRTWEKALETKGASLNESRTAWQKFLGI